MITRCPICRYSLAGLPEKHRCPECGFEYDKDSMLFAQPRAAWGLTMAMNLAAGALAAVGWWFTGNTFAGGMAVIFLLSAIVWDYRFHVAARSGLLLTNDQVREIRQGAVFKTIHLGQIDRAEWSRVDGRVSFYRGEEEIEMVRTAANRAVAQAIQARLAKRKHLTRADMTPSA